MEGQAQKRVDDQKIASVMKHPTRITPAQLSSDIILGATSEESSENVNTQSDSLSKEKKHSTASLDLTHAPGGHRERL